ncbi:MAG: glycosyltransferase family 4 protein [Candidatus Cloacimonas sp.]|jgi:glycosyltransferase involved in cell wall biosynthesis|nr:glycosyltransferase family 4 protein [Candidatus Cloacimonas sp.]
MRIVWLCHFTTSEIQDIIKPLHPVNPFAPWISNTIKSFENRDEVDLHIVSPHRFITRKKEFVLRGIHYSFYPAGMPFWGRQWPSFFRWDLFTKYSSVKNCVSKIITRVHPDVIHLQGAENPYYSIAILQFLKKYPVLVNLQRMNVDFEYPNTLEGRFRKRVEKEILTQFNHFSIRTNIMEADLLSVNPSAVTHWVRYSIPILEPKHVDKLYDIVFFARVSPTKGIEDLLQAAVLLDKKLSVCIIGAVEQAYRSMLTETYGKSLDMVWLGNLPVHEQVFIEASKAKISVLPTHQDIIPGTIIESMMLGLPVVSYNVGSIPELNLENESVLLAEKGDIECLAKHVNNLLTNPEFALSLAKQGRDTILKRVMKSNVFDQHLNSYQSVISDFSLPLISSNKR